MPIGDFVKDSHFGFVLTEEQRFFLDVETLIDSSFAEDVLLYGSFDEEFVDFGWIEGRGRLPLRRGYDLNDEEMSKEGDLRPI